MSINGNDIAIRVQGLSKLYEIGGKQQYKTFRESISGILTAPLQRFRSRPKGEQERTFWALNDVNFEVKRGDVVGIIGRNGAGKSTLLKILSRITEPTTGRVETFGRVGSLLEVGTGFHPELTGRENVFLNGAILGMKRAEIAQKFEEIVAFSEVERFLDTPVKHYSSGMYTRLAFAVAAHLEPEILIVDEVLAVGDIEFQKKCLGKMGQVARLGRTVIFVSHNLDAVARLCNVGVLLSAGRVTCVGDARTVIEAYLDDKHFRGQSEVIFTDSDENALFAFRRVAILGGRTKEGVDELICEIEYEVKSSLAQCVVAVKIDTPTGAAVMTLTDSDLDVGHAVKASGHFKVRCPIPSHALAPGTYQLTISAADMKGGRFDYKEHVLAFDVQQHSQIKTTFRREGPLLVPTHWQIVESMNLSTVAGGAA